MAQSLAESAQAREFGGHRIVERFVVLGVARYGLGWEWMMASRPGDLNPMDSMFISKTWIQFTSGEQPFRKRHRVVYR